jgi:tetratricopeptide (TPR) repeat protein
LYYKKCQALVIIYPRRWFFESFYFYRRFTRFDYSKFQQGGGVFVSASSMFIFTGLSFWIGKRILSVSQGLLNKEDARQMITYDVIRTTLNYFQGNWKDIGQPDDDLVERNLSIGEVLFASLHYYWHGFPLLYQGDIAATQRLVDRLIEIADAYENETARLFKFLLNAALLMECRRFPEAITEIDGGLETAKKNKSGLSMIHFLGCLAQIHLQMGEISEAEKALTRAGSVSIDQETVPWVLAVYCRSQAELSLNHLKNALAKRGASAVLKYRVQAYNGCRTLLRQTRKVAQHRTEACRLMGEYRWLTGRRRSALNWWRKSIHMGTELGARIPLSRTYFEIGRRLQEPGSPFSTLDGMEAQGYIDKAATLFAEMRLDWDLAHLRGFM